MAYAGVAFLLEKVRNIRVHYSDLIGGATDELKELEKDVESLNSILLSESIRKLPHEKVETLMRETRETVDEVEDTLDTCLTAEAAAAKPRRGRLVFRWLSYYFFRSKTISMAERVNSLGQDKVKEMIEKAKATAALPDDDHGHSSRGGQDQLILSTTVKKDQAIRQHKIVGLEDEEQAIRGYLMEPKDELDVISIIGMPGLGKTTLAWKIYNSETIQNEFRIRIWVNLSQNSKIRDLFLNILRNFTSQDKSSLSGTELEAEVRVCLKEERFLIVLDDANWSVDDWDAIEKVLTIRNTIGKVLITSRHMQVGKRPPQMLRFLNKEESWHLLQVEVFDDVGVCPVELRDIGKQLAHNCNGLPLTIVVVGGILAAQYTRQRPPGVIKDNWIEVSENVTGFIQRDKSDHILKVVALSYSMLPDELRDCFLYVGVFPEDYEIPAWTLTRLWIAEGFIQKRSGQTLEATAESYLNDLINRNLLTVGKTNPMGSVKTCRVYDVIRVFCISKAAELDLFHEVKNLAQGVSETRNTRRLCIHSDVSKFLSTIPGGQSARSLLCFYRETLNLDSQQTTAIPRALRLLRVLDSNSIRFHQFPQTLTDLIHLKYITLSVHDLKVVPESMAGLWNLQSLVVDTSSYTLTMKANIWRMIQLRHLKTKASIVLDQQNWEGKSGENLQTLTTLSPESFNETVSNRASYLKKLGIRGQLSALPDPKLLGKLGRLESLKLVNGRSAASTEDDRFRLPQPDYFPLNLKTLTLCKTSLDWTDMSMTLAKINTLEVLKLKDNAFTGITWKAVGDGFPSLQFLLIADADLVIWEASADHFPRLTCLSLSKCEKLREIPQTLATNNLQKLDIDRLRSSAVESAKKIQIEQKRRGSHGFQLFVGPGRVITV